MPRPLLLLLALVLPALALVGAASSAAEEAPLHQRIDRLIAAQAGGPVAARSGDAEFLRRVHLDLAGRIPTLDETRTFLADQDAAKREKLIDRLLSSDDYAVRFSQLFHVMLMERLGDHAEWQKWLRASLAANKPWDQMVREMLRPNAEDEAARGAALFLSKRLENYGQNPVDVPGLVRDVGRLFMGIDVQCAQCHDHLFVDDYKQEYYQGLFAFVGNLQLRNDKPFPAVGEKLLTKKIEFMSVFVKEPKEIGPWLPGKGEFEIPVFAKGEEYEVKPDPRNKVVGVPKFSTLKLLSEQLPTADNQLFKRNIANRLWWALMGRGLVHPLDLTHADNPASHPELLDLLANELAARQFDLKWLLKELVLSETYQRTSVAADAATLEAPPHLYRVALEKPISAEQLLQATLVATGQAAKVKAGGDAALAPLADRFAKALANPPREPEVEHAPSVKGALFLLNDDTVLSWLQPADGNLTDRLAKLDDFAAAADELYLAVLSRPPTSEEREEVASVLKKHAGERPLAIRQLVWALLASNEFCLNH